MRRLRVNITMSIDGEPKPRLRQVQAVEAPGVTHIRYVPAPRSS
jgi:hypothetical protein